MNQGMVFQANTVKAEGKETNLFDFYAEAHPVFYNYSESHFQTEEQMNKRRDRNREFPNQTQYIYVLLFICLKKICPKRILYATNIKIIYSDTKPSL